MTPPVRHPGRQDKKLFTPGPLTTSVGVKQAMLRDLGSRDDEFIDIVRRIRRSLCDVAGLPPGSGYEAVLLQGSGTQGIESVIGSVIPPGGRLLVVVNGAYGARIADIARRLRIATETLECPETKVPDPTEVGRRLDGDPGITDVAVVHCETTTGILNPVEEIGRVVRERKRTLILDSMSAFGGIPLDLPGCSVDYLVSSPNKCLEGVPGFSFVICRRDALLASEGDARSLSLDLVAQWRSLEANGQFRFTPPTHALLAFERALEELEAEGGVEGRASRYTANHRTLMEGMEEIGFEPYLPPARRSVIIATFRYPVDPRFDFGDFYRQLSEQGFVIYPGKVTGEDCFRIGTIGRLFEADVRDLLAAIRRTLADMGVELSSRPPRSGAGVSS